MNAADTGAAVGESSRGKWTIFLALLMLLLLGVAVIALAGGDEEGGELKVERYVVPGSSQPELLISVDRSLNVSDTAKDGRTVRLTCSDGRGKKVLGGVIQWPFVEEPNYALPHYHQPASDSELRRIAKCRLTGTTQALEGQMRLRN